MLKVISTKLATVGTQLFGFCIIATLDNGTTKETLYIYQEKRGVPRLLNFAINEITKEDEEHIVARLKANPKLFLTAARRKNTSCVTIYR